MLSKLLGQKYATIAKAWVPTMTLWGTTGGVAVIYFTDWQYILKHVPYIGGKYKKDD